MYSSELRDLLAGIGTPKPAPFKADQFQLEALAALEFEDVLVTAPDGERQNLDRPRRDSAAVGSGKTSLVYNATQSSDQFQVC
jgi:hypothetical protein